MNKLTLTNEQLDFMLTHHAEIEESYDLERRGRREESLRIIQSVSESEDYKGLFGEMDWDDAYDRYEDAPEYDSTLRDNSIRDIQQRIKSGQFSPGKNQTVKNKA